MSGPIAVPAGSSGYANSHTSTEEFAFNSSSPILVKTCKANETIVSARVIIDTTFDGVATVSLGDSVTPELFLRRADIDAYTVGAYMAWPDYAFLTAESIKLFLQVAGSTQGAGRVIVEVFYG